MLFTENILVALAGLKANIMRSLLTMLGIIIGIASVIAIMTVGNSITLIVNSTMQDLGANNLEMGVMQKSTDQTNEDGTSYGDGYVREMTDSDMITDEMIQAYKDEFPDDVQYILKIVCSPFVYYEHCFSFGLLLLLFICQFGFPNLYVVFFCQPP